MADWMIFLLFGLIAFGLLLGYWLGLQREHRSDAAPTCPLETPDGVSRGIGEPPTSHRP